jgi:hypothetical protein
MYLHLVLVDSLPWHILTLRKRRKKDVASEPRDAVLEKKLF